LVGSARRRRVRLARCVGSARFNHRPSIGPPSSAHFGRNGGGWTIGPALRARRATARIPENQPAVSPPFSYSDAGNSNASPALAVPAGTYRAAWEAEILAFHVTNGCSNGPTEAVNLLIKKVQRSGTASATSPNYRLWLRLHCGIRWPTHPTARLRGRSPRLVA
jgi:hypothetical protein